jgi:hypothetical protein
MVLKGKGVDHDILTVSLHEDYQRTRRPQKSEGSLFRGD